MKAIVIADDDLRIGRLTASDIPLLISCGDLRNESIALAQETYRCRATLAVRGNHDPDIPLPPSVEDLHLRVAQFGDLTFGGFAGSWRYKPDGDYLFEQREVKRALKHFPRVDVFVAHNSPRGIHERDDHVHQGFDAFLRYIEKRKPRYFLHGHQHIDRVTQIGETTVIGVFGEQIVELDPA